MRELSHVVISSKKRKTKTSQTCMEQNKLVLNSKQVPDSLFCIREVMTTTDWDIICICTGKNLFREASRMIGCIEHE